MIKTSKILGVLLGMLLTYNNLMAFAISENVMDKVIATVDNKIILQSEIEKEYQLYTLHERKNTIPTRCQILENRILNKVLLSRARKQGVHVKKEEINTYFNYRMQMLLKEVGSEEQLEIYTNKPIQEYKEELRKIIKEQLIVDKIRNTVTNDITLSPAEVKDFFNHLELMDRPFYTTVVEAYQLVVYPKIALQQKQEILTMLIELKTRIQAGENFSDLAKQYSEDESSSNNGGNIEFCEIGELDAAYEKAFLSLEEGEISEPVETKFGFHIIQLIGHEKERYNTRHILIKPVFSSVSLQEAISNLNIIRTSIVENKITFEKAVASYSEDMDTAKKGGLVTDLQEGIQTSVDQLTPDLFFILDKMQPGDISEPIKFTNPLGQIGYRIVYLKEKIPSHQATLEQDYEKIYRLALNDKKQKALNKWIKSARGKTDIYISPAYASYNG